MKNLFFLSMLVLMVAFGSHGLAQSGNIDSTFGNNGVASFDYGVDYTDFDDFISMTVQPDGKILFLGSNAVNSCTVFRLNDDGSLDFTFNNCGSTTITFPEAFGSYYRTMSLAPSGKIIVTGNLSTYDGYRIGLACLLPDGTPDLSFDGDGRLIPEQLTPWFIEESLILPDGRIILTGSIQTTISNYDLGIVRLLADGTIDSSFNNTGTKLIDLSSYDWGMTLAIADYNKLVVGGLMDSAGASRTVLVRVNEDGTPDSTFHQNGILITHDFSGDIWPNYSKNWLRVQPDDKIVYGLSSNGSIISDDFAVKRIMADGTTDVSFGVNGISTIDFDELDWAHSVALTADGKIVVSGRIALDYFNTGDFAMATLNEDGSIDSAFGTNGKVIADISANDRPVACLIQPDQKIVMGGNALQSYDIMMVLARFQNGCTVPVAGFTFSLSGTDLQAEGSGTSITSWHWDFGDGTTDSSQNAFHTYTQPGTYNLCLVASNGCAADTTCQTITIIATSAEEFPTSDFKLVIAPNPFVETASILYSLAENTDVEIELLDLQGKRIKTIAAGNFEKGNHSANVSANDLRKGLYLVQLKCTTGVQSCKLVIQ